MDDFPPMIQIRRKILKLSLENNNNNIENRTNNNLLYNEHNNFVEITSINKIFININKIDTVIDKNNNDSKKSLLED